MDGNRRWAKEQNLHTLEGHQKGLEVFLDCIKWIRDEQIPHAIFYAFSTENWKRSEEEVAYLMNLFAGLLNKLAEKVEEEKIRVRMVGRCEDFSPALQRQVESLEEKSKQHHGTTIWVALSYGGRAEIIDAVNRAVETGEKVDESTFEKLLWTTGMPDPDMIVRTSGEERLSNFLPWQAVYSEFYFIDKHWPALTKNDFKDILCEYEKRERRKGS